MAAPRCAFEGCESPTAHTVTVTVRGPDLIAQLPLDLCDTHHESLRYPLTGALNVAPPSESLQSFSVHKPKCPVCHRDQPFC